MAVTIPINQKYNQVILYMPSRLASCRPTASIKRSGSTKVLNNIVDIPATRNEGQKIAMYFCI